MTRPLTMRGIRHFLLAGISAFSILWYPVSASAQSGDTQNSAGVLLREGTLVTLKLFDRLQSEKTQTGAVVELIVYKPIIVDGKTLIKDGAYGEAKVRVARPAGGLGHPGELQVEAINVEAVDGKRIALLGELVIRKGETKRGLLKSLGRGAEAEMDSDTTFRGLVRYDVIINE